MRVYFTFGAVLKLIPASFCLASDKLAKVKTLKSMLGDLEKANAILGQVSSLAARELDQCHH